ncbi:MAG: inositol 2-dehydrogenase, partial [Chloroflexi bacterium]|nr:inositol 2-dehydrogenase [Chloroflexota bacterium]MDL1916669.1 inositol 2-dehydrogenase [Anaerolineae bacterium CFX4]
MAKIGIGVIGLGRMGRVYANFVAGQLEDAELVAVSDPQPSVLAQYSVTTAEDYTVLLADPHVDAVIVTTPTHTHREIVIAAAQAGKAIFCEKPTALTLRETDEMIAAVNSAGVLLQIGFMRRFDRAYSEAKRQIDAGVIGTPVMIRSIGRDPYRTSLEYADPSVSGGLIVDMGIHDFDVVRWLTGDEIQRVYAETAALVYPELTTVGDVDNAQITLKFESGGLGNIEVSRTAKYGYDIRGEVVGTEGALQIGYLQETAVLTLTKAGVRHDVVPHFPERFGPAYTAQIAAFVTCVRDGKPPAVTAQDARAALQAAIAATRSQHTGQVVAVADV